MKNNFLKHLKGFDQLLLLNKCESYVSYNSLDELKARRVRYDDYPSTGKHPRKKRISIIFLNGYKINRITIEN